MKTSLVERTRALEAKSQVTDNGSQLLIVAYTIDLNNYEDGFSDITMV